MTMGLKPFFITGETKGLMANKKPFLFPDQAWSVLYNAYTWREREKKREGPRFLGRLRRVYTNTSIGNTGVSPWTFNLFSSVTPAITEPHAELEVGSVIIKFGGITFTDQGNGQLTSVTPGNSGTVNYVTGSITLTHTAGAGVAATATFNYFPSLPVMGIWERNIGVVNDTQTIWWDTTYAYINSGTGFQEFIPGTTWTSSDSDFFWAYNYQGNDPSFRLLFETNFVQNDPMRYTDGITWTTFQPALTVNPPSAANLTLFQAKLIIPYFGRLLVFNTWEGDPALGSNSARNFPSRCRFSQETGSPVAADAWRTDIFGKGGIVDAPTTEAIIGATFVKNTLLVHFEQTTWQLRWLGEYGQPFIWERVSADFGSESTFSNVIFDNHMLSVGDTAITASNAVSVERIDLEIPDEVFTFKNANNGTKRVFGIRDYQKELVYWNFADSNTEASPSDPIVFPNKVLVYNYRNNSYAIFRDNVTAFGNYQLQNAITWDRLDIYWDDMEVTWDSVNSQTLFPSIVSGNQQGFVHVYANTTDQITNSKAMTIQAINLTVSPIVITSTDHNLQTAEIIYITGLNFLDGSGNVLATDLNNATYQVRVLTKDTFSISKWNTTEQEYETDFPFTPVSTATYVGGGTITYLPKLQVRTKDINLFMTQGLQTKTSYIDFLLQPVPNSSMNVTLFVNTSPSYIGNLLIGNKNVNNAPYTPFYNVASDYAWFRLYTSITGQFFNIEMSFNDDQMNTLATHQNDWNLYAIQAWCRPGGRSVFQ